MRHLLLVALFAALLVALLGAPAAAQELLSYDDYTRPPQSARTTPAEKGNDFRYKVLFKFNLNHELNDASTSEASYQRALAFGNGAQPSGVDGQAAALASRADYLSSDHVLGTEGLGWKHLRLYYNGFFMHRFEDYGGSPSPTFPTAYLTGRQQTAYDVRAGYGEVNGFKEHGFWSKVFVRAGRQFRYGAGISTFDGITAGYQSTTAEVAVFTGRRSPRFLDNLDPGFVTGVSGKLHLDGLAKVPVDLGIDYLLYAGPEAQTGSYAAHHLILLDGQWRVRSGGRLYWSLFSYDLSGMRAHVGFSRAVARVAHVKVFYDVKVGRDIVYDYVSGSGMNPSRYFTMPDIEPRSRIGLRWDHTLGRNFEYGLYANFNIVHGTADVPGARGLTGATAFDATYEELGVILRVQTASAALQTEAEYRIRLVQRQGEVGRFSDSSQAGERQFQEVRADLRLRPARGFSMLLGAVARVYDYVTRYVPQNASTTVSNDFTAAGTMSLELWLKRRFLLRARYEVGQDSQVFARELGAVHRLYATVGGRF